MIINAEKIGTAIVARIQGELDMANADQLRESIDERLDQYETIRDVYLICDSVPFIDSSGLAVLLGRYRKLEGRGGKLFIANPSPQVRRVMELSGLSKLVGIYDNWNPADLQQRGVTNG